MDLKTSEEAALAKDLEPGRMLHRARAMAHRLDSILAAAVVRPSAATADAQRDAPAALAMAALAVRAVEAAEALAADADLPHLQATFARYFSSQPGRAFMQRVARSALQRATEAAVTCRGFGGGEEKASSPEDVALAEALAAAQQVAGQEAWAAGMGVWEAEEAGEGAGEESGSEAATRWSRALAAGARCSRTLRAARRALPEAERDASVALFAAGWRRPTRCLGPSTLHAVKTTLDRVEVSLEETVARARLAARGVVAAVEAAARPRAWALYADWRPTTEADASEGRPRVGLEGCGTDEGGHGESCGEAERLRDANKETNDDCRRDAVNCLMEVDAFSGAGDPRTNTAANREAALVPKLEWECGAGAAAEQQGGEGPYSLRRRRQALPSATRSIARRERRRTTAALRHALKSGNRGWIALRTRQLKSRDPH